ncbi:MAG: phosphate acetyltransferase [Breznakia sp.]
MLTKMLETIKGKNLKIVFPEGNDERILQAVARLQKEGILVPLVLGNTEEVCALAKQQGCDLGEVEIIDPQNYADMDSMVQKMVDLRKGKMNIEECRSALQKTNYFGTMLVAMGVADGLVGGATYSTADTVRPALQIIKTKPGSKIVSSAFVLVRGKERYVMGDCAINIKPSEDDLVEIALESAKTARVFGVEPRVGMLSYSTLGSGKGEDVDKVRKACDRLKLMDLDFVIDGEFQFDCALDPVVAKTKAPNSSVAGTCNTFIFPSIESGNIGYKIAQRLGGFEACGPILQGLNAPINDLSRGCNAEEIYKLAIITAAQKFI